MQLLFLQSVGIYCNSVLLAVIIKYVQKKRCIINKKKQAKQETPIDK